MNFVSMYPPVVKVTSQNGGGESGAAVKNLAHSASLHSRENIAPSKSGIKQLVKLERLLIVEFQDRVLIFLVQHAVPHHQNVNLRAHEATEGIFR